MFRLALSRGSLFSRKLNLFAQFSSTFQYQEYIKLDSNGRFCMLTQLLEKPTLFHDELINTSIGKAFIFQLRRDLNLFSKQLREYKMVAKDMDKQLKQLLSKIFHDKSMELREITYNDKDTSSSLLHFIMDNEGVHRMNTINDLKNRLQGNRKCYGLFYNDSTVIDTPLVFIHVALTNEFAKSIK